MVTSKKQSAAHRHVYSVLGSSRHFAQPQASGQGILGKVNARLGQASLGPPTWFPALSLTHWPLKGERKCGWSFTLTQPFCCAWNCCAPEGEVLASQRPPALQIYALVHAGQLGMISGFMLSKADEAQADREEQDGNHRHPGEVRLR